MSGNIPTQGEALPNGPRRRGGPKMQAAAREELGPKPQSIASLLPVKVEHFGGGEINAVSALAMYRELGLASASWSRWSKMNIVDNTFALEHEDWEGLNIVLSANPGNSKSRAQETRDFMLSIPFAKKLAMQVRTPEGEMVRDYFLECEKRANDPVHALLSMNREAFLEMALQQEKEKKALKVHNEQLQGTISVLEPKADALDRIATFTGGSLCLTNAAKSLQIPPRPFMAWLQEHEWIYRRLGGAWTAYQQRLKQGVLEHKIVTIEHTDGRENSITEQVRITSKGLTVLARMLKSAGR